MIAQFSRSLHQTAPIPVLPPAALPLAEIVGRCLAKEPAHRFGSAREVQLALEAVRFERDDLSTLDWKVYARSNRLYTRQFRETTNVAVMLVIDTSASMAFPVATPGATALTKFRYASIVAASLAYLASEQGNAVGLMSITGEAMAYLPVRSGRAHLRALIARIDGLTPSGAWHPSTVIRRAAELLQRRGLLIVLSDFYDDESGTQRELRHVAQRGHDVSMLQMVAREERELTFRDQTELQDMETGARLLVEPATTAEAHHTAMTRFLERCRGFAVHEGIDYGLFDTSEAPERALRDYLVHRATQR